MSVFFRLSLFTSNQCCILVSSQVIKLGKGIGGVLKLWTTKHEGSGPISIANEQCLPMRFPRAGLTVKAHSTDDGHGYFFEVKAIDS